MARMLQAAALLTALLAAGCTSDQQYLEQGQNQATTALQRGRFELNCPAATAAVLSRELVQPAAVGWRTIPITRSEYTVGVSGCGQRATYVVVCPQDAGGCFAAAGGGPVEG
jgi:outer membrane murein-binding lipoprotein Lpp